MWGSILQFNLLLIKWRIHIFHGMVALLFVEGVIVLVVVLIVIFATTAEWVVEEVIILPCI